MPRGKTIIAPATREFDLVAVYRDLVNARVAWPVTAGRSWSSRGERLSVRSVRGTRLTRPIARPPRGSRNSYAKHELLDAADSGRARRSRGEHPRDRYRVVPRGHVPAPVEVELARGAGTCGGRETSRSCSHQASVSGHLDSVEPREPPRPHPAVRGLEPRRVRIGPHEPQRVLVRHPLRMRDRPEQRPTAAPRAPQHPRQQRPERPRGEPRRGALRAQRLRPQPGRRDRRHRPCPARQRHLQRDPAAQRDPRDVELLRQLLPQRRRELDTASRTHPATAAHPRSPGMSTAITSLSQQGQSRGPRRGGPQPSGCSRTSVKNARGSAPVSTADPPATAAVLGGRAAGKAAASDRGRHHVADVAGDRGRQQRLHRRVVQDRGDGEPCSPISRVPSARRATRDASSSGPSQDLVILSGARSSPAP